MRSILVAAWAMTACDAGAPTCKDAVTKVRRADEAMSADGATKLVDRCELEHWSVATRTCIAAATSHRDLDACLATVAPEDRARAGNQLAVMRRFTDEMCQCTTPACAQRISDEMTRWGQEEANGVSQPPKLTDDETKAAAAVGAQMGSCMQKAMGTKP